MDETKAVPKVVIVGGGHNGLVAAALLARQGADVTVLEKNPAVGGAAFTGHPWGPDIDMTRCSYSLGMMDQELIDDLELETRFGLKKVAQWGYFAPREDGYLQLPDDDPTLLEWELTTKAGRDDLRSFRNYKPTLKKINEILQTGKTAFPQGAQARALMRELQQVSVGQILDDGFRSTAVPGIELGPFNSEALKGILSVTPVIGTWGGPYDKASTYVLLNLQGNWGFPVGGMGAVSDAIERAAIAGGAKIRVNALVDRIEVKDGKARGVVLNDGMEIPADVVVTAVHPQISYLELITSGLPDTFLKRIRDWDSRSGVVKINLVVSKLPTFKDHPAHAKEVHGGTIVIGVDSPTKIQHGFDQAKAGHAAAHPMIDMAIPSVADPSLIRGVTRKQYPDAQVISLFTQYGLDTWAEDPDPAALQAYVHRVLDTIEGVAPGFCDSILPGRHPEVLGPHEIEELYGLKGGNIYAGTWDWNERLDVTTPIQHLYDASSGTHGGGCVSGKPGLRAANQIIDDLELGERKIEAYDAHMDESAVEALYAEQIRGVNCQATDLESIRTHCGQAVVLGGVAAGVFVAKGASFQGVGTWIGFFFLFVLIASTVMVYLPLTPFRYSTFDDMPRTRRPSALTRLFAEKDRLDEEGWHLTAAERVYVCTQVEKGLTTRARKRHMSKGELLLELVCNADAGFWRTQLHLDRRWRWHNLALAALVAEALTFILQNAK